MQDLVMAALFTHTLAMDWMLPRRDPKGRKVEFALVAVVASQNGKISHKHIQCRRPLLGS